MQSNDSIVKKSPRFGVFLFPKYCPFPLPSISCFPARESHAGVPEWKATEVSQNYPRRYHRMLTKFMTVGVVTDHSTKPSHYQRGVRYPFWVSRGILGQWLHTPQNFTYSHESGKYSSKNVCLLTLNFPDMVYTTAHKPFESSI